VKIKLFLSRLVATFGFVGYLPFAPGTWASLLAVVVWLLIPWQNFLFRLLLILGTFFLGIFTAEATEKRIGEFDPPYIVIDEVVGMWLTLLFCKPVKFPQDLALIIVAFVLFRIFDISKIRPIDKLELIGGGFGIMIDDVLAAGFAGIVIRIGMLIL